MLMNVLEHHNPVCRAAYSSRGRGMAWNAGEAVNPVVQSSFLLSAVRAERLARRVEAVRAASGAFAAGHKFWGNQWSEHAKDLLNDPVGEPAGKIKHAVLVIGGKRFKGPSHFQAYLDYQKQTPERPMPNKMLEGFESESGHFLDRKQAARFVEHHQTSLTSEEARDEYAMASEIIGGRLYTQDAVQAAEDTKGVAKAVVRDASGLVLLLKDSHYGTWDLPGGHLQEGENVATGLMREIYEETGLVPFQSVFRKQQGSAALFDSEVSGNEPHVALSNEHTEYRWVQEGKAKDLASFWMGGYGDHDAVRAEAQQAVARAVNHVVVLAEAEELSKKRKDDDEFFLLASTIFVAALAGAYGQAARQLAINAAGQDGGESLTQREETEYGASRQEFLENFARDVRERIRTEAARGRTHGEADQELVSRVRREGDEINTGAGKVVAETEAQAIYGHAQLRALRRAGYKTAYWVTVGDERVRDSHTRCEAAGAVRIGDRFPNGLMYPGDPAGGPEEVCNCRCWLEGASRGRAKVNASEHDVSGEKRDADGKWTTGGVSPVPYHIQKGVAGIDLVPAAEKILVRTVASHLNSDLTVAKIEVHEPGTLDKFERGGKTWQAAGYWKNDTKTAQFTADPNVIAHELGHAEFDYAKERALFGMIDAIERHQSKHGGGAPIWQRGEGVVKLMQADGSLHEPQSAAERLYNAILKFKWAHGDPKSLPTEYARSWADENIWDAMPARLPYKEEGSEHEIPLAAELSTPRALHEAYAEYSAGKVMQKLNSKGLVEKNEIWSGHEFDKMDGPKGRKAYLDLKAAIDEVAKERRK